MGDPGLIPKLGRSPGGGHGNPLQYSYLENPHGQKSLAGYSPRGGKESDMTEWLSTHVRKPCCSYNIPKSWLLWKHVYYQWHFEGQACVRVYNSACLAKVAISTDAAATVLKGVVISCPAQYLSLSLFKKKPSENHEKSVFPKAFSCISSQGVKRRPVSVKQSWGTSSVTEGRRAAGLPLLCERVLWRAVIIKTYRRWGRCLRNVDYEWNSGELFLHEVQKWLKGGPMTVFFLVAFTKRAVAVF